MPEAWFFGRGMHTPLPMSFWLYSFCMAIDKLTNPLLQIAGGQFGLSATNAAYGNV